MWRLTFREMKYSRNLERIRQYLYCNANANADANNNNNDDDDDDDDQGNF